MRGRNGLFNAKVGVCFFIVMIKAVIGSSYHLNLKLNNISRLTMKNSSENFVIVSKINMPLDFKHNDNAVYKKKIIS